MVLVNTMCKFSNSRKVCIVYALCLTLAVLSIWSYISLKPEGQWTGVRRTYNHTTMFTEPLTGSLRTPTVELVSRSHRERETTVTPRNESEAETAPLREENRRITEQRGYLVVLDIPEQFTAATEDLAQLYMFNARHLKLGMIEPYVLGSRLKTVPPVSEDFKSLPLISTFFNRSLLLNNLKRCFHSDDVDLHPFPEFLINAARQFIVVTFVTAKAVVLNANITACTSDVKHIEHVLNYHLEKIKDSAISKHGVNYTFKGVYSLCVRALPEKPFSMKELAQVIRIWMNNRSEEYFKENKRPFSPNFSVVVPEWRAVKNVENHHYYFDPSYTGFNMTGSCALETLTHTSYVTQAAKGMLKDLSLSRPFIAVHVRSERISQPELEWHRTGFIDSCISNFSKLLQFVMKEHETSLEHVVFIHDGSQYGSDSMWEARRNASNYIISRLKKIGIRNVQFKPQTNFTDANSTSTESALVQFVEKEFLVSADTLILLGYGGFQHSLIKRFKRKRNGGNNWYKLCSDVSKNDHFPQYIL